MRPVYTIYYYFFLACSAFISLPLTATATELKISVFSHGKTVKNATVCVGTKQQRNLYAISQTNSTGSALFKDLPEGEVVITASIDKRGKETTRYNNLSDNIFIALPDKDIGPLCKAERSTAK